MFQGEVLEGISADGLVTELGKEQGFRAAIARPRVVARPLSTTTWSASPRARLMYRRRPFAVAAR